MPVDLRAVLARWATAIVEFLPQLLMIVIITAVTIFVARRARRFMRLLVGRTQAPIEVADLLARVVSIAVAAFGAILVLQQLGWTQAVLGFVAGLGIAGIAIGFALQDIVKQFTAGMVLLMLRPFQLGDYVRIDAFEGTVMEIQLRATVLKTDDGNEILIPNADVYNKPLTNMSRYDLRRQSLLLQLPRHKLDQPTFDTLIQLVAAVPGVADSPAPVVTTTGLAGDAAPAELRFWVDTTQVDREAVRTHVAAAVHQVLVQE